MSVFVLYPKAVKKRFNIIRRIKPRQDGKMNIKIKKEELNENLMKTLLDYSKLWEAEDSCYGYHANSEGDIEGRDIFVAYDGEKAAGYLFGIRTNAKENSQAIPAGTPIFEIEEIFVLPEYRSHGIGGMLFTECEKEISDVEYFTLSTGTKNYKSIMHFYIEMMGMTFRSARLFKEKVK